MLRPVVLSLAACCGLARAGGADDQSFAVTMNLASDSTDAIGGDDLYLDVTLNGGSSGLAHFGYRDGALWATNATLHQLGFVLPADTPDPVRMSSVRGVQVDYDQAQQSVAIVAPLQLLQLATQRIGNQEPQAVAASTSPGAVLNYSFYGIQSEHGASSLSAFTELRAFNALGVLSTTALSQATFDNGNVANNAVRLDSSWSTSFPDKLLTLRVGDSLTGATSWSRSTRIGGIQLGTNFALQPYLVTTPLIAYLGQATLPSQVELLVNGIRQYSGDVPAGPFQLNSVPRINGAGTAQVVLTDALGRVNTVDFSLYNSQQLLQKGLSDWSAEVGYVREDYGLRSFEYSRDVMASATWRFGVTHNFTAEGHAETTSGLTNAGVGAAVLLDTAGVVSASAARSQNRGTDGSQISLGYNWTDSRYNFAVNATRASQGYRDVASLYGSAPPRLSANGQAGFATRDYGSFGVSYIHLNFQDETNRYGSAYWFKSINQRLSLNLNVNQNLDQSGDRSIFLGFNLSLDNRTFLSSGIQNDGNGTTIGVDAIRSIPSEGGFGWRTQAQAGDGDTNGRAELDYLGRYGQVQAGVSDFNNSTSAYANANGALVLIGGSMFASRTISSGFAVVSTDGIAEVPVRLENNLIGTTDDHGMLLITPLNSYQNNRVSIDPMDLPADVRIDHVETVAAPKDRSGTVVRFGIKPVRAASLILVDADGKYLSLGSQARLRDQKGEPALVGFDGSLYLDTLGEHNVLDVDTSSGTCHVAFDYRKQDSDIPQIGPLSCRQEQP